MTREDFCRCHWEYYLILEKDLMYTERYIKFERENSQCFSDEFVKQYQAICSEIDVVLKSICKEINCNCIANNMNEYTEVVLQQWPNMIYEKVKIRGMELQPFVDWQTLPQYKSPNWWSNYNKVKHNRLYNYKKANLINTLNALAGLYILERYFVKFIADRDDEIDVPNDVSRLFEMLNFYTKDNVLGKELYTIRHEEIDEIFSNIDI